MTCLVIMHNIIIEYERDEGILDQVWQLQGELVAPQPGSMFEVFRHVPLACTVQLSFSSRSREKEQM
jgi:hypothetical protein